MYSYLHNISFIINKNGTDSFFSGRSLAKEMYSKKWSTKNMCDDYDIGIVAFYGDIPIGNINIQLKKKRTYIPSERYFEPGLYPEFMNVENNKIGELCGLAISDNLHRIPREYVLGGLILNAHLAAMQNSISVFATVQKKQLINKLINEYNYPFFESKGANLKCDNMPDDNYWKHEGAPSLYYINLYDIDTINASFHLLTQLTESNIKIVNKLEAKDYDTQEITNVA